MVVVVELVELVVVALEVVVIVVAVVLEVLGNFHLFTCIFADALDRFIFRYFNGVRCDRS